MDENELIEYCNKNDVKFVDITSKILKEPYQGIGAYKLLFGTSRAQMKALQNVIDVFDFEYVATFEEPTEYGAEAVLFVKRDDEHWLLDENLKEKLRAIGSFENEGESNPTFVARFYVPNTRFNWFVVEGEPSGDDYVFFGYVELIQKEFDEFGYFALSELEELQSEIGVRVLRDYDFEPFKASEKVDWIKED